MKNTILFTVVMLFCNMAFAQMQYIPTNGKSARLRHASPKEENAIRVYTEKSEVPANAEKIGVLVGNYRKKGKAFIAAKSFAAQAKGDAILYVDGTDSHTGNIHDKGTYNFNVYRLKTRLEKYRNRSPNRRRN